MIRKRLFCGLVVIGRRWRIDAESDTREETIHEGLLRGDLEVLRIFHVVLNLVVTRFDETIDELVVLDYGDLLYAALLIWPMR